MFKTCLSFLLCFLLLPKTLFAEERGPVVKEVSPEVFERLIKDGKAHQFYLAQADAEKMKKKKEEDERLERASHDANQFADIFADFGTGGTKDAALVIFAIVGVVVVVAWIPYVPVLLYDYLTDDKDKFQLSQLITFQGTTIIGEGGDQRPRHGGLLGARYSVFVEEIEKASKIKKGLSFESGYYLTKEEPLDNSSEVRNEGAYWLIGPSLMVGDKIDFNNSLFAKLDLMAGTSFDRDLGLVMKADFSGHWLFRNGFTFGAGIGGLYLHVKNHEGVLADANDIALTFSGIMGYAF